MKKIRVVLPELKDIIINDNILFEDAEGNLHLALVSDLNTNYRTFAYTFLVYNYNKRFIIGVKNVRKISPAEMDRISLENPAWFV